MLTPSASKIRSGKCSSNSRLPTSFLPTGGSGSRRRPVQEIKKGACRPPEGCLSWGDQTPYLVPRTPCLNPESSTSTPYLVEQQVGRVQLEFQTPHLLPADPA